jgi:hypothetical protein
LRRKSEQVLILLTVPSDFDSAIRRFDPSRPSQPVRRSARLPEKRETGPRMPALPAFDFVSTLPIPQSQGRQLAKVSGQVCRYSRLARTVGGDGGDRDCCPHVALKPPPSSVQGGIGAFVLLPPDECNRFLNQRPKPESQEQPWEASLQIGNRDWLDRH